MFRQRLRAHGSALDADMRSLRSEIGVGNEACLLPGVHANVALALISAMHNLIVTANTLRFRSEEVRIALIDAPQNYVRTQLVMLSRDSSSMIEASGDIGAQSQLMVIRQTL